MFDTNEVDTANQPRPTTSAVSQRLEGEMIPSTRTLLANTLAVGHPTSPFTFMKRFAEDLDRLFEDFETRHGTRLPGLLGLGREFILRETSHTPTDWSPPLETKEREGKLTVRADLPAKSKDPVKDESLSVQCDRRPESKKEHDGLNSNEGRNATFFRSPPLSEDTDRSKVDASFREGC